MTTDVQQEVQKWLELYERGWFTWREVVFQTALLAVRPGFFNCLAAFPERLVAGLRETALNAPAHPEDLLFINAGVLSNEVSIEDLKRDEAAKRPLYYWCARALRERLFPELPHPEFESIARVGVVEEAARIDGAVVLLFENLQWWLTRENPVHCFTPLGERIPVTVVSTSHVKHNCEDSPDILRREWGRPALTLGSDACPPERFPPGTTVWVDRTNIAEIPPLELPD